MLTPTTEAREALCDRRGLRKRPVLPRSPGLPRCVCVGAPRPRRQSGLLCRRRNHSHTSGRSTYHQPLSQRLLVSRTVPSASEGTKETSDVGSGQTSPSSRWRGGSSPGPHAARPRRHSHTPASDGQPAHLLSIQWDLRRPGGANPELQQQPQPCPVFHSARPFVRTDILCRKSWALPYLQVHYRRNIP